MNSIYNKVKVQGNTKMSSSFDTDVVKIEPLTIEPIAIVLYTPKEVPILVPYCIHNESQLIYERNIIRKN